MIFADTNVLSELTKPLPNERVVEWLYEHRHETLLSTLTVAELRIGIRTTPGPRHRAMLEGWLTRIIAAHEGRIVAFDLADAVRWGEMGGEIIISGKRSGVIDSMLAAQALVRDLPIATRNVSDFEATGVALIDPWQA